MSISSNSVPRPKSIPDVPLTTRSVRIRKDMLKDNGTAKEWRDSWPILRGSLNNSKLRPVFGKSIDKSVEVTPKPRRFSREWLEHSYAKILDGDREIREKYLDCSTVFITLTSSGYRNGHFCAPIDQYYDIDRSWTIPAEQIPGRKTDKKPIYDHINKQLARIDYDYVRIDGVHDGRKEIKSDQNNRYYAHRHILFYVDSDITAEILKNVFYPIVDLHIKYCPTATRDHHYYSDAIRWDNNPSDGLKPIGKMDRTRGMVTPAARDIASHIPDVRSDSTADRLLASMMYAVNKRSWSDSTGFRRAYQNRYERETGRVHPSNYDSNGTGQLLGWQGDGGFIPKEDAKDSEDFMTTSEPIPYYY